MSTELVTIPLSKLRPSADNVRKTGVGSDLDELAASIATLGVLQNLSVRPSPAKNGEQPDTFEVVAGGRRLAALKLLAKRRRIAKNYPVPCRISTGDVAAEVSLAENVVRTPLHPADQYEAFSKLRADGLGIEDIAADFGVTPAVVRQRLKLAAVSPTLMEVYRKGEMTLDQLVAFTLTDDHGAQERVWFDGNTYDRSPHAIRRMLTRALVAGNDRRARFIGAEAYEAAGGAILRDLFSPAEQGYFTDSVLLDRLVAEKLAREAENLKTEGWAWVEAQPEPDHEYLAGLRHIPPTDVTLSDEEEATLAELSARYDELVAALEEGPMDGFEAEFDRVSAELNALVRRKEQWTDEQKARAGAVVSLDYHGTLSVVRGLTKDESPMPDRGVGDNRGAATRPEPRRRGSRAALPEILVEDLSAHRTAALRESIAGRPAVAMTALLHALVLRTFFGYTGEACVDIQPLFIDLRLHAKRIGESKAAAAMAKRHQRWLECIPEQPDGLWAWLSEQSAKTRSELLAYCVAVSVNAVQKKHAPGVRDRLKQADTLAIAVALDMADWWEPTKEGYLSWVSKAQVVAAVVEAVSVQAAENIAGMKKDAMATRAEELLAGRRWLPEPLRAPVSASDDAADSDNDRSVYA